MEKFTHVFVTLLTCRKKVRNVICTSLWTLCDRAVKFLIVDSFGNSSHRPFIRSLAKVRHQQPWVLILCSSVNWTLVCEGTQETIGCVAKHILL